MKNDTRIFCRVAGELGFCFGVAENEKPLQVVCKGFVFWLQSGCKLSFASGVFAVVGRVEWVIGVGGELYHCQICDVDEVFAIVVSTI